MNIRTCNQLQASQGFSDADLIALATDDSLLFHYTSYSAFRNIVETKKLRATHFSQLSDTSEVSHAMALLRKLAYLRMEAAEPAQKAFLEQLLTRERQIREMPIFTCSFTADHGNLLSQWQAYCPTERGGGLSFGIDPRRLKSSAERQNFRMLKCSYDIDEHSTLLDQWLDEVLADMDQYRNSPDSFELHSQNLIDRAVRMKAPAFNAESEWRLVKTLKNWHDKEIKFRDAPFRIIPYIELELPVSYRESFQAEGIFIGPSPEKELSRASVQTLLASQYAVFGGGIRDSEIPLRV